MKAVVIGGGVIGASCALHLREAEVPEVVLLESADSVGAQTTSGGAGFVAYWGEALVAALTDYATAFYSRVQEEAGIDLGVRRCGLLLPALSESGEADLRVLQRQHSEFYDARWLDEAGVVEASPIISPGVIRGALWQPRAHRVPTARMMAALGPRMAAGGIEVRLSTKALGVELSGDRVVGVRTADGRISADVVVNAAGAWAHALAAEDGVSVGAIPLRESRFVTEPASPPVDDGLPLTLLFERDLLYFRPENGGLLVGAVEHDASTISRPPAANVPDVGSLGSDGIERHEALARQCADVAPLLGELATVSRASGMPTFTPDGQHVLGAAPGIEGYYVAAGCNEGGVAHGPGLAWLLSELITTGSTTHDISPYRVGRFADLSEAELSEGAVSAYLSRHRNWRADA
jgi:4-methylaminobutanoate oxidase (formaldehyde-forming)